MHKAVGGPAVIAVFGLGYVGCVTAAGLASLGHRVIGVDRNAGRVASVQAGEPPFYEPGLAALLMQVGGSGRLTATGDAAEALLSADVAMICVGTPSAPDGSLDATQIEEVAASIALSIKERAKALIVVVRSTLLPGMCESVIQPHFEAGARVTFVSNPEFLREAQAVEDFLHPSLIVVGGEDAASVRAVADLYRSLGVDPVLAGLREAEMVKYACNALNAVKIDFANEIGTLCASFQIAADRVMEIVSSERKDRSAYLKPGFAFGGACLPKDLRALLAHARQNEIDLPLLASVLPSNDRSLDRAAEQLLSGSDKRLGVFGLAFKAGTDDLRESASVRLIERLIAAGRHVRVFDACFPVDREWPSTGSVMVPDIRTLLAWSEEILLIHRPGPEVLERILTSGIPVRALYAGKLEIDTQDRSKVSGR